MSIQDGVARVQLLGLFGGELLVTFGAAVVSLIIPMLLAVPTFTG